MSISTCRFSKLWTESAPFISVQSINLEQNMWMVGLDGMVWILWVFRASYFTYPLIKNNETVARAITWEQYWPVGYYMTRKKKNLILPYLSLLGSNLLFASRVKRVQVSKGFHFWSGHFPPAVLVLMARFLFTINRKQLHNVLWF